MNETQARTIREAHDGYVKSIYRKPKTTLANMYRLEMAARGITVFLGGPSTKDELISALVELRYPLASMNESVHVLYHRDGITNDVCEHCAKQDAPTDESLIAEAKARGYFPGMDSPLYRDHA